VDDGIAIVAVAIEGETESSLPIMLLREREP
jgi:hypothetical protein